MTGDAFVFVFTADHKAGDVLQEHQRDFTLAAQLDKVRAFLRRLTKQDAVIGDNADWHALDMSKAADQRVAKARFKLIKGTVIDDASDDFFDIKGLTLIGRNDAV